MIILRDTYGLVRWWINTWDCSYILTEATDTYLGVWEVIEVTDV
jgi:hypothetical protein